MPGCVSTAELAATGSAWIEPCAESCGKEAQPRKGLHLGTSVVTVTAGAQGSLDPCEKGHQSRLAPRKCYLRENVTIPLG